MILGQKRINDLNNNINLTNEFDFANNSSLKNLLPILIIY